MRPLYASNRAARLLAPAVGDVQPHPEGNITDSYQYDAMIASAWWGFILHGYRTGRLAEAWANFEAETDAWLLTH